MPKKLVISSHNVRSKALKALQEELSKQVGYRVWRVKPERVRNRVAVTFNKGVNKIEQFTKFHEAGISVPVFATTLPDARNLPGDLVCVRRLTRASEGRGLSIVPKVELDVEAPLYTQYIKKKAEYRAHVYNNKVILLQQKKKKIGFEGDRNTQIRNQSNGYIFSRVVEYTPPDINTVAIAAVQSLGWTQGAVDIIHNERQNKCYALEVNARPGMQGSTPGIYVEAVLEDVNIRRK